MTALSVRRIPSRGQPIAGNTPTTTFTFSPAAGTTRAFDAGRPADVRFFGSAKVAPTGGPDGSGFLDLTDASAIAVARSCFPSIQSTELGIRAVEGKMHTNDLHATLLALLGLDHERLTYRYAGRDLRVTKPAGEPSTAIFA